MKMDIEQLSLLLQREVSRLEGQNIFRAFRRKHDHESRVDIFICIEDRDLLYKCICNSCNDRPYTMATRKGDLTGSKGRQMRIVLNICS